MVHNNGANISHQTVSALKHFQCQQRTTGQNNSANHCFYMQSWSDPFLFYKPAIFSLHPNITLCCSFQISTMNSMQNWSDSYCKTVISILNLARTILQTSDQNWSDSIFKPVIPFLNLARTSLQTSGHVFKPVIFKFILHPPYHHITS